MSADIPETDRQLIDEAIRLGRVKHIPEGGRALGELDMSYNPITKTITYNDKGKAKKQMDKAIHWLCKGGKK